MLRIQRKEPFASSSYIKKELQLDVDSSAIRKHLIKHDLKARSARKVPYLSKKNVTKRLAFAKKHVLWPKQKWRNILFSDETKSMQFNSDRTSPLVMRPPNQTFNPLYTIKTVKHGGGNIMVWFGPLHRIKDTMNAESYCEILDKVMLPYAEGEMPLRWVFQQDNDPKHTSKRAKSWFDANNIEVWTGHLNHQTSIRLKICGSKSN